MMRLEFEPDLPLVQFPTPRCVFCSEVDSKLAGQLADHYESTHKLRFEVVPVSYLEPGKLYVSGAPPKPEQEPEPVFKPVRFDHVSEESFLTSDELEIRDLRAAIAATDAEIPYLQELQRKRHKRLAELGDLTDA